MSFNYLFVFLGLNFIKFGTFAMMEMKKISLKKGKESNIERKHPWIFSGAIYKTPSDIKNGDHVQITNFRDEVIAIGHYASSSIAVRILDFNDVLINKDFYIQKLRKAKNLRRDILQLPSSVTNCYRLVAGEADDLAGLIIDIYNKAAVIQCHSMGMLKDIKIISSALDFVFEENLDTIYLKPIHIKDQDYASQFLKGEQEEAIVLENNHKFHVNWVEGQKTGFFLDQRENRQMLASYSKDKNVLNTFCYTGGFSVYALLAGAKKVDSVDISESAMTQTDRNILLNQENPNNHQSITANVLEYLKDIEQAYYNLIILDPPAFAKNRNKSHNAVQAYKRLNLAAMKKIAPNGIIFTFSCSQVIDRELFESTIRAAAIECGRNIKILKHLNQAPDHAINIFHQEGHYLKGLILHVE